MTKSFSNVSNYTLLKQVFAIVNKETKVSVMSQIIPYLNLEKKVMINIIKSFSNVSNYTLLKQAARIHRENKKVSVMSQIIPYLNFGHFPWVSI